MSENAKTKGIKNEVLLHLLEDHHVTIPMVQRDYAQGRTTSHATYVRKTLLKDMKAALLRDTDPLDLSFVYGKKNKEGKFVPLDGQQRLTTLFLLHVYAFRNDDEKTELLKKFTYETRKSSLRFIRKLVEKRGTLFDDPNEKPSDKIKDADWFFYDWEQDPTVKSCLVMLDAIREEFSEVGNLGELLEKGKLVFQFLPMDDFGMDDSLYIKLNARGKPLTDFENFKARLLGQMKKLKQELAPEVSERFGDLLDREWTEFFWNLKKSPENINEKNEPKLDFDTLYLNFFEALLFNALGKAKGKDGTEKTMDRPDDDGWLKTLDYATITAECVESAYYTLNYLSGSACDPVAARMVLDVVLATKQQASVIQRLLFHSVTKYLYLVKGNVDPGLMTKWLRVCRNLLLNSGDTIDRLERYYRARESLNKLVEHANRIDVYLANESDLKTDFIGFSEAQAEEEQIKARLILDPVDPAFAEAIYEAEKHPYFSGKVNCALWLSKKDGGYDRQQFCDYWERIAMLFKNEEKHPEPVDGDLLRRALLSLGDYTVVAQITKNPLGGKEEYRTLCVDDLGTDSTISTFKTLFSQVDNDVKHAGGYVKQLLKKLDPTQNVVDQLQAIGDANLQNMKDKKDWRYCFVLRKELMKGAGVFHYSASNLRFRHVDMPDKDKPQWKETILIPAKRSNGLNYEIFTLTLLLLLKEHGFKDDEVKMNGENGTQAERWLEVKDCKVVYRNGAFEITGTAPYTTTSDDPLSEALEHLKKLS